MPSANFAVPEGRRRVPLEKTERAELEKAVDIDQLIVKDVYGAK
jgi:hypothetical protein